MTVKTTVMVVDDDASLRQMYTFKLRLEGFTVLDAENGQTGLALAKKTLPDILLLDLSMPVMNGVEMLRILRGEDWGKNIRVIILTNISKSEAPKELQFFSVSRYVIKAHTTPSQVLDVIRQVLL